MLKKENKNIIIFISCSLLFILLLVFVACIGNHQTLKYFELNDKNEIQLKAEYIDIETLFGEERYTKEEIKKVKKFAKEYEVSPQEFVFVSLLTNGGYNLDFENVNKIKESIESLEKTYQKDISLIYEDHCKKDAYLDVIVRAKLSTKQEIMDKEVKIDGILKFKKVAGIADSGLLGADFEKITINDSIEKIGNNAFCNSFIQEIYLGKRTLVIGNDVLSHCNTIQHVYSTRFLGEFTVGENNDTFNDVFTFVEQ